MYNRKLALSLARQRRRCPPLSVINDPAHGEAWANHRSICPYCADESAEFSTAMQTIAQTIATLAAPTPLKGDDAPLPGQIRYLATESATWRDGYYYPPPMVLILKSEGLIADAIRVAQLYDDPMLAGPGDLILEENRTGGAGELFVECWNVYTLRAAWLGSQMGHVSADVLDAIGKTEKDPAYYPAWGVLPVPMREGDPRIDFRELEVEVAYTFAARVAEELMATYEATEADPLAVPPDEWEKVLFALAPGIRIHAGAATLEDMLATARLPDEMLPLAAADSEANILYGNRVTLEGGCISALTPMELHILNVHAYEDGTTGFSGRIILGDEGPPTRVEFRYALTEALLIEPETFDVDDQNGYFTVTFATDSSDWRRLRLAAIDEKR